MVRMAIAWRSWFRVAIAVVFLVTVVSLGGCSTFHERPGHSPFSASKKHDGRSKKKSSMNPLSGVGSLFKKEEPKLAQSPEEFVGLPRPEL